MKTDLPNVSAMKPPKLPDIIPPRQNALIVNDHSSVISPEFIVSVPLIVKESLYAFCITCDRHKITRSC